MPCRECKALHTNPMSSNLCSDCGVAARKEREDREAKEAKELLTYTKE